MFKRHPRNIYQTLKTILIGMRITLQYCFARTVTVQYPDQPPVLQPRFRGFHWYEIEKCSACKACAPLRPRSAVRRRPGCRPGRPGDIIAVHGRPCETLVPAHR